MAVEITVREVFSYNGKISQLKELIEQAEKHGLTEFNWTAYNGDQRDPAQLTITAKAGRDGR